MPENNHPKKVPIRRCVGCMQPFPKKELIRVVRTPQGDVVLDPSGKLSGRGAYLCPRTECLKKARKARRIEKNLECQIPDEVYDRLEGELLNE